MAILSTLLATILLLAACSAAGRQADRRLFQGRYYPDLPKRLANVLAQRALPPHFRTLAELGKWLKSLGVWAALFKTKFQKTELAVVAYDPFSGRAAFATLIYARGRSGYELIYASRNGIDLGRSFMRPVKVDATGPTSLSLKSSNGATKALIDFSGGRAAIEKAFSE